MDQKHKYIFTMTIINYAWQANIVYLPYSPCFSYQ